MIVRRLLPLAIGLAATSACMIAANRLGFGDLPAYAFTLGIAIPIAVGAFILLDVLGTEAEVTRRRPPRTPRSRRR